MYIHFRLLNLSAWLTVLLVLFIPGRQAFDGNQRTEIAAIYSLLLVIKSIRQKYKSKIQNRINS